MDPKLGVIVDPLGVRSVKLCKVRGRNDVDAADVKRAVSRRCLRETDPEDSPNNHHDKSHHHKEHGHAEETTRHKVPFYSRPKAMYRWGEPKEKRHPSWGSLFFDLIYVGVSFKAGAVLAGQIAGESVFVFLSIVLVLYSGWFARLMFEAMLSVEDNYHKFNFLLQGLFLAFAAHNIPAATESETSLERLGNYSNGFAMAFSVCMVINHVLRVSIWAELYFLEKEEKNARKHGFIAGLIEVVPTVVLAMSIVAILADASLWVVSSIWFASYVVARICWLFMILSNRLTPENSLPWDVNYTLQRFGQYTILMLGEGVLQIIIFFAPGSQKEAKGQLLALFILSYLMLGVLQLLHYSSIPFRPEDHALLNSRSKGVFWLEVYALYSVSQLSVGVALKKMLALAYDWDILYKKSYKYYYLLQGSLCVLCFLLALLQIAHLDFEKDLGVKYRRSENVLALSEGHDSRSNWLFRLLIFPFLFLPFVAIKAEPVYVVLASLLLTTGLLFFQIATGRFKRKRKMNRTVAIILAIGKLKLALKRRRLEMEAMASALEPLSPSELSNHIADEEEESERKDQDLSTTAHTVKSRENAMHLPVDASSLASDVLTMGRSASGSRVRTSSMVSIGRKFSSAAAIRVVKTRETKVPRQNKLPCCDKFWRMVCMFFRDANYYEGPPRPKKEWTEIHEHSSDEVDWADLFFDLTFVGVAFRLNELRIAADSEGGYQVTWLGSWIYFSQFLAVFDCWSKKNVFQATFAAPDVSHKLLDIIQGCLIAFMASQLGINQDTGSYDVDSSLQIGFAVGRILFELTMFLQFVEILVGRPNTPSAAYMKNLCIASLLSVTLLLLSFVTILLGAHFAWTTLLWSLPYFSMYAVFLVQTFLGKINNGTSVPVDIHHVAHRYGELALIMIGEGILSIILSAVPDFQNSNYWMHYLNFTLGYFDLSAIRLLYFFVERFIPERMGSRKSRIRGIFGVLVKPFVFASLGAIGGLAIWSIVELPDREYGSQEYIFNSFPNAVFLFFLWITDFLHEGPEELSLPTLGTTIVRVAIYILKFYLVAQFFVTVYLGLQSWGTLTLDLCTTILAFVAHALHHESREYVATRDPMLHELELEARNLEDLDKDSEPVFTTDITEIVTT